MISNKLLKLARLIKCITEIATDKGLLITDVELGVGVEVFVTDPETGDMVPAPAGEYITDNGDTVVVNQQGIVDSITAKTDEQPIEDNPEEDEKPAEEEKPAENNPEEDENPEEKPAEEEAPAEEEKPAEEQPEETPAEDENPDEKDAKIAELQGLLDAANAKIAELEALVAEYQAKEQETPESIDEENRKQENTSRTDRILNAYKNRN